MLILVSINIEDMVFVLMREVVNISNGKNLLIFGVHESSLVHQNNKANNIYVMGDFLCRKNI